MFSRRGGEKKWRAASLFRGEEPAQAFQRLLLRVVVIGLVPKCLLAGSTGGQSAGTSGKSDSLVFVVAGDILSTFCEFSE